MKLEFNKNFERNLVKLHGFSLDENFTHSFFTVYRKRNICISIRSTDKAILIQYFENPMQLISIPINGCKTMNDLYRLELLIEGKKTKSDA